MPDCRIQTVSAAVGTVPRLQFPGVLQLPPAALTQALIPAPTATLKGTDVAVVRPARVALSVYPVPTLSIESPAKVATPATALTVVTPESVPPAGFVPMATETGSVKVGTMFPPASRAATATMNGEPGLVAGGCTVKVSAAGAPMVMLNAALVAAPRAPEVARIVIPVPSPASARSLKVATPATAARVSVPPSTAPEGLLSRAIVTFPVKPVTSFPSASRARTVTAGASTAPEVVLTGCTPNTSCVAAPTTAVAENDAVAPPSEGTTARAVCTPGAAPSVSVVRASPLASVVSTSRLSVPPPVSTSKLTGTPCTPRPSAARTRATRGCASASPTVPVCAEPDWAMTFCATGCTAMACCAVCPVASTARTGTTPRSERATMVPARSSVIESRVESAGFTNSNPIGVPGITVPCASRASASSVAVAPKVRASGGFTNRTAVAFAPVPTYVSRGSATRTAKGELLTRTGIGPARKTVSPAASVIARTSRKSRPVSSGTVSRIATLSTLTGKATVVSTTVAFVSGSSSWRRIAETSTIALAIRLA